MQNRVDVAAVGPPHVNDVRFENGTMGLVERNPFRHHHLRLVRVIKLIPPVGSLGAAAQVLCQDLPVRFQVLPQRLDGGRRAAAMYSLIESAKLTGLNPQLYLTALLARIADHPVNRIGDLLPWNWAERLVGDTLAA